MFMLAISSGMKILTIWFIATYVGPKDPRFDANCYYKKKFGNTLIGYEFISILLGRVCSCTNQVFRISVLFILTTAFQSSLIWTAH